MVLIKFFTNTYKNVYNSVRYDWEEMESIQKRVHNKIKDSNSVQYMINVHNVIKCIKQLKAGKSDGDEGLMSDYIINAPHRLSVLIIVVINAMIIHGMSPESMLIGTMIPIPKANLEQRLKGRWFVNLTNLVQ